MSFLNSKDVHRIASQTAVKAKGELPVLEGAVGALYFAQQLGWKPIFLIHDKKTIRKYEEILGIEFRTAFPEVGPRANDSLAYTAVLKVSNFWKAVKGEIPGIRTPTIDAPK